MDNKHRGNYKSLSLKNFELDIYARIKFYLVFPAYL